MALLEQLCRDITRPALPNEHVQTDVAGQVVLKPDKSADFMAPFDPEQFGAAN